MPSLTQLKILQAAEQTTDLRPVTYHETWSLRDGFLHFVGRIETGVVGQGYVMYDATEVPEIIANADSTPAIWERSREKLLSAIVDTGQLPPYDVAHELDEAPENTNGRPASKPRTTRRDPPKPVRALPKRSKPSRSRNT